MVWVLSNGVEDTPLKHFFLSSLYSLESIFSGIVWIDKLHNCVEVICFNVEQGSMEKTLFLLFMVLTAKTQKCLINTTNPLDTNCYLKKLR